MTGSAILATIAVALVAALGTYLAAARRLSGKIGTSEAGELWAESKAIRDDYARRQAAADVRAADLEKRVAQLERDNNALSRENIDLVRKIVEYEAVIADLRGRLDALERENKDLRDLVTAFQERLGKDAL